MKDYQPVTDLNDAIRDADVFGFDGDETAAMEFICTLDGSTRLPEITIMQSLLSICWLRAGGTPSKRVEITFPADPIGVEPVPVNPAQPPPKGSELAFAGDGRLVSG